MKRLLFAAALLAACDPRPAPKAEGLAWDANLGCAAQATLPPPAKLTEVVLRVGGEACAFKSVVARIDMPDMPMGVAPVSLVQNGPAWEGTLVFTMAGPWYVEIEAVDAAGITRTSRHDLRVP